ncbi:MAG: Uma2 family endonuclease [Candidatus Riflebacteria bacterium]|nr:Uma2 family endonuclease [Candidatus Riflebacteria bacterium]
MDIAKKIENREYTYSDISSFPAEERWEVILGELYNMTPAPCTRHQEISGSLFNKIYNFLEGKPCMVFHAPFDVRLPEKNQSDDETTTVVQPDILVVCDEDKIDEKGCRGAPDWIVEILSPSTRRKDLIIKTALYEKHKVKEYWVIYPDENMLQVFEFPKNENSDKCDEYIQKRIYIGNAKATVNVLPGLEIDLRKVFGSSRK